MADVRRRFPLRVQLLLLQLVIVLATVSIAGVVAVQMREQQIRDAHEDRMIGIAQSVAQLPQVREAFEHPQPAVAIQPVAEVIRQASKVTYVVVTDAEGIRFSHPNPERIGEMVSTDPSVPLSGETFVGTETGTLGESWRVKVPVWDSTGEEVIGTVSVGTLESELRAEFRDDLPQLLGWLFAALVIGTLAAAGVSRLIWRRIYRLEPEQIATLLEARDAMLHGIGEGVIALDDAGRIVLVNDEAARLLDLREDVVGQAADEVLDASLCALLAGAGRSNDLVLAGERILLARHDRARVDDREVGSILILRDRTELHAMLRDLDGARDLTQALRAQAHEFANRMHVLSGLLELGQVEQARAFIERLGHGGALDRTAHQGRIDDPDLVALLLAKATTAAERDITVNVLPASTFTAEGTSDVLAVVGNLIDNAVDAIGNHGTVDVEVVQDADGGVRVRVGDDGPGVPAERRERIFDTGVSTKQAPGEATRGIGLALVARIADRRRGRVRVEEGPLGGAEFVVELGPPLAQAAPLR